MMQAVGESVFDIVYLITVVAIGIWMTISCQGKKQYRLFGIMAIVLGCGDAFHLIPRVIAQCTGGFANNTAALGVGKFITSVTMTIFYVILYHVWRERYEVTNKNALTMSIYILAVFRIVLCLFPQNQWISENPPLIWGIYRNIPFAILGFLIAVLFFQSERRQKDRAFRWMWLTIVLSFGFYIPVVLFAEKIPMIGMLMIPKTCAYVWTVTIGYLAMKNERNAEN